MNFTASLMDTDENFIIFEMNESTENGTSVDYASQATSTSQQVPSTSTCSAQVNMPTETQNPRKRTFKDRLTEYTVQRKNKIQHENEFTTIYN